MNLSVCLFVCPVAYLKKHIQTSQNFLYVFSVAVAQYCYDAAAVHG